MQSEYPLEILSDVECFSNLAQIFQPNSEYQLQCTPILPPRRAIPCYLICIEEPPVKIKKKISLILWITHKHSSASNWNNYKSFFKINFSNSGECSRKNTCSTKFEVNFQKYNTLIYWHVPMTRQKKKQFTIKKISTESHNSNVYFRSSWDLILKKNVFWWKIIFNFCKSLIKYWWKIAGIFLQNQW